MASLEDKVRKARNRANDENWSKGASYKTEELVMDLTRGKKSKIEKIVGRSANAAEQRAANVMQQRRRTDTARTASRAQGIAKRVAKKKIEATVRAGVSGGTPKKQAPKVKLINPKTKPAMPKAKTTKKPGAK